jgi:hypothetical protein
MNNKRNVLFWVLVLSLTANIFAVSYFFGAYHLPNFLKQNDSSIQTVLKFGVLKLSPDGQEIFKKNFLDKGDSLLAKKDVTSVKRLYMLKKIGEPSLNEQEIQSLMEETASLTSETQKEMQKLFLKTLIALSPEDRKIFSDHLVAHFEQDVNEPLIKITPENTK